MDCSGFQHPSLTFLFALLSFIRMYNSKGYKCLFKVLMSSSSAYRLIHPFDKSTSICPIGRIVLPYHEAETEKGNSTDPHPVGLYCTSIIKALALFFTGSDIFVP